MQKKTKVFLAVAVLLLVLLGLFASRSYLLGKYGLTADIKTTEKLLNSKSVAKGDFRDDTLSNASISGSAIRVDNLGVDEVCGSAPASDPDIIPGAGTVKIDITEASPSTFGVNLYAYYLGPDGTLRPTGSEDSLTKTDEGVSDNAPGIKLKRGNGWVYVELGKPNPPIKADSVKVVKGKITFQGVNIKKNSIQNVSAEKISDGESDSTGDNDEVSVNSSENSVNFVLATKGDGNDGFYINYCFSDKFLATGYAQGVIDLGKSNNLTRLTAEAVDVNGNTSRMNLTAALSKDGESWTDNYTASNASTVVFKNTAFADTFCYRYIRYRVNLKTTDPKILPGFSALNLYGGGACQAQPGALDVECQDGKDNDGDGKIDYPDDQGCFSPMDDSENKAKAICQDGTNENISLKIELDNISNTGEGNLENRIYVDSEPEFYKSGQNIPLVEDGVAIKDSSFNRDVPGVAVQRGNGWVQISMYGGYKTKETGKEAVSGKVSFKGAGVKKAINGTGIMVTENGDWDGPFENQGDGKYVLGGDNDEFMVGVSTPENLPNLVEFYSTVTTGIDSFYIYYDYDSKVGGGCQCQDKKDNDNDGKIDYPTDPGCFSPVDNDETDDTVPNDFVPECSDGIDNDDDGLIDFPDDPGCYSSKDNSETKPVAICQDGSRENMKIKVNIDKAENEGTGNMEKKVFVGSEDKSYSNGQWIDIVTDGVAKIDNGFPDDNAPGVQIQRGKGWVMIRFAGMHPESSGKEITTGSVEFEGTTITHWLNGTVKEGGPFDGQGDGLYNLGKSGEDEFFIPIGGRKADFYSTATTDADAMFIYYDYTPKTGGGCQCQDGLDNDGDGYIDYPNDPGCDSPSDNDEIDDLDDIIKEPDRILPAAIKSGISFYIIIAIVLLIGGFVIYRIARKEPNGEPTQPAA